MKYKKGVAKELLDLCVGNDLDKTRKATLQYKSVGEYIYSNHGEPIRINGKNTENIGEKYNGNRW